MVKGIVWKIGLFLLITLISTVALAVVQEAIHLDFETIMFPQWGPAVGFLLMVLFFRKLRIPVNLRFNKLVALKSVLALGLPFLFIAIAYAVGKAMGLEPKGADDLTPLISMTLVGIFIGSIGEELGWRSFLQPTLEKNTSVLLASVIVGLLWGLWHFGQYVNGGLFMLGFLVFTISASILLSWILRNTNYSIILSTLFHASINIGFFVFMKNSLADPTLMLINGIVWLIPALIIIAVTGKQLSKTEKGD